MHTELYIDSSTVVVTTGKIFVDTSRRSVLLLITPPSNGNKDTLIIKKITNDNNSISLFCNGCKIDDNDIIIFGLSPNIDRRIGTSHYIELQSNGPNWKIIREF